MAAVSIVPKPTAAELQRAYADAVVLPSSQQLSDRAKVVRAGVIPYTIDPGGCPWFAVCIDKASGDLCDCGGMRKDGESVENAGARELYEESARIFDFRPGNETLRDALVATNGSVVIFFLKIAPSSLFSPDSLAPLFAKRAAVSVADDHSRRFRENSLMYWISEPDLKKVLSLRTRATRPTGVHYSPVRIPDDGAAMTSSPTMSLPMTRVLIAELAKERGFRKGGRRHRRRGDGGDAAPADDVFHPMAYEAIRRILFPTWGQIILSL